MENLSIRISYSRRTPQHQCCDHCKKLSKHRIVLFSKKSKKKKSRFQGNMTLQKINLLILIKNIIEPKKQMKDLIIIRQIQQIIQEKRIILFYNQRFLTNFILFQKRMNPIFNQKYKTTLCRHWLTTNACSIGVRCVFAHGQAQLRNPNDPITLNQNILTDPKMLTSFMTTPLGDVAHINAMVSAQQLDALAQEKQTLKKALNNKDNKEEYENVLRTAREYLDKPHFDITTDPMVQKRLITAQMKLIVRQLLRLDIHPILRCKVSICEQLLQVDNIDACSIMLDSIMQRPTASERQKQAYLSIIDQASELSIQLIAEEKVKFQRLQKDQETLIKKQHERALIQSQSSRFY